MKSIFTILLLATFVFANAKTGNDPVKAKTEKATEFASDAGVLGSFEQTTGRTTGSSSRTWIKCHTNYNSPNGHACIQEGGVWYMVTWNTHIYEDAGVGGITYYYTYNSNSSCSCKI